MSPRHTSFKESPVTFRWILPDLETLWPEKTNDVASHGQQIMVTGAILKYCLAKERKSPSKGTGNTFGFGSCSAVRKQFFICGSSLCPLGGSPCPLLTRTISEEGIRDYAHLNSFLNWGPKYFTSQTQS